MKSRADFVTLISSVLMAIISLFIAISIPAVYFIVSYRYMGGSVNAEIAFSGQAVEALVANNPNSWRFEEIRLQEILERRLDHGISDKRVIRDMQGHIITQTKEPLVGPVLTFSQPIHNAGKEVARLEIERSMAPLLRQMAFIGAGSALLALMIFFIFRFFPLRAVRRAYHRLEENEQRLTLALKSERFGVWDWDIKNNVMIWDDRMYEIYGVSKDSVAVSLAIWQNCIHPEDRERVLENISAKVTGEREFNSEFRIVWPDGTVRYIKGIVTADREGKPSRIISVNYDITERKLVEEALRKSEKYFKAITESATDILVIVDQLGLIKYASPSVEWVAGYRPDELMGKSAFDLIIPDDIPRAVEDFSQSLLTKEVAIRNSFRISHKDGSQRIMDGIGKNFLHDPIINGFIMNIRDVSDHQQALEAMRESEFKFRSLVEHALDCILIIDLGGTILFANNAAVQTIEVNDSASLVGRNVMEFIAPESLEDVINDFLQVAQGNDAYLAKYYLISAKGKRICVESIGKVISFEGKPADLISIRDITKRNQAEEEKERLQGQLLQAQKMESVGRLAGGVAHDFNNMLGVILGHTEIAMGKVDANHPLYVHLQEIRLAAEHSADLTHQLLAFARKQTVMPKVIDMNATIEGMLKMLLRLIGEDIHLIWLPSKNLWPVKVDPSQIDQILANLCINARDAITGVGKVTIETGNSVFDEGYCANHAGFIPGDYVLLAVSDNGCGMDKEVLGMLFEPFFTTKGVGKGTGLGLSTVYGIVRQNDGFINVYSEPQQGTTFRIYLPRHTSKTEQVRMEGPQEPVLRGHETVLVVEDEPAILEMSKLMLEQQGYRILTAGTPGEAIRLAEKHAGEIHLLMTDVVMPEMNGRDLAKELLSLYPNLKRLFMSGYTANVIAHHGVLDEGITFIQKPFSIRDLAAKVREALDKDYGRLP
jgi:two-component system, cell cycle sensor histidine kinase and response regulator CckA